ncbi:MAG: J domain-containing protein [Thermomicrobiales bacterium]
MPVEFKDYYAVLGISRTADQTEVKRAFRENARKFHPDVNRSDPRAEERFKDMNEAYEVLSDPEKRARYDRFGRDWQRYRETARAQDRETPSGSSSAGASSSQRTTSGPSSSGNSRSSGTSGAAGGSSRRTDDFEEWFTGTASPPGASWVHEENKSSGNRFSDFFTMLFGGFTSRGSASHETDTHAQRGDDTEVPVPITLDESVTGTKRHVALQILVPCQRCHSTGYLRGIGCPTCDATGVVINNKTLEVSIPKGVRTGSRVRLAAQGEPGINGGPNGDVYLNIEVRPDTRFERQGNNLRQKTMIPVTTAVLGGEVIVPTMDGRVSMTVPPGTQDGAVFRLKGLGMPVPGTGGDHGDMLVETHVAVPKDVSAQERELFTKLRDLRQ